MTVEELLNECKWLDISITKGNLPFDKILIVLIFEDFDKAYLFMENLLKKDTAGFYYTNDKQNEQAVFTLSLRTFGVKLTLPVPKYTEDSDPIKWMKVDKTIYVTCGMWTDSEKINFRRLTDFIIIDQLELN